MQLCKAAVLRVFYGFSTIILRVYKGDDEKPHALENKDIDYLLYHIIMKTSFKKIAENEDALLESRGLQHHWRLQRFYR